jgi:hypothetical protein
VEVNTPGVPNAVLPGFRLPMLLYFLSCEDPSGNPKCDQTTGAHSEFFLGRGGGEVADPAAIYNLCSI